MSGVIILGSARSKGNTFKVSSYLSELTGYDMIDLNDYTIGQFDYEFKQRADDFHPLFVSILDKYDTIVFATPIYWYSMSGTLKKFFDRISDFLMIDKDNGRRLRGKNMAMISCGSDAEIMNGFEMPFVESANYLGMKYLGDLHTWLVDGKISTSVQTNIDKFAKKLKV